MMTPFQRLDACAAPLALPQCDTDQIVPARFLSRKRSEGFGEQLFHDLRFDAQGQERPAFVLNQAPYRDARILVADENFGCGSSRESAVWALIDYGIAAVIAPSFGDIFFNNSTKTGLLPVVLPAERVHALRALCEASAGCHLRIDLADQLVHSDASPPDRFEIDPLRKRLLLAGMDEIAYTLTHAPALLPFEARYDAAHAWL